MSHEDEDGRPVRPGSWAGSIQLAGHDVYEIEMPPGTLLDNDVELLLTGDVPDDYSLADLAPVVASLRAEYAVAVPESQVVREGAGLAAAARRAAADTAGAQPTPRPHRKLRRKLVSLLAAAVLLGATTGVAYAVEDSLPGDAFYGLKRAFETVGLLNGGVEARIAEAEGLFASGKVDEALAHAAEAAESGDPKALEAAQGLQRAAEALRSNEQGSDRATDVRSQVADRFDWMATTEDTGRDFGEGVAERAANSSEEPGANASNRSENASENAADPEEAGNKPDHAAQPRNSGNTESSQNASQGSGGSGGKSTEHPGQGVGKPSDQEDDGS